MGLMMKNIKTLVLAATAAAAVSAPSFAADYSDDIHKNDYKWLQFNAMYSVGEKPVPTTAGNDNHHNYLEMEFGGRSGIVDLYGYVDIFNLGNETSENGDKNPDGTSSKLFMKFAPRLSLDAITGKDLSFGPVQELYFATLFNWDGMNGTGVNTSFWGLGADVMVPWLGKTGMNLYAHYNINTKEWNGYQFSANWFKPFVNFDNGSFLAFQGYLDWQFGADSVYNTNVETNVTTQTSTSSGGNIFFGLYWHSDRYALGYGLKGFKNVYLLKDHGTYGLDSTGWSHYFSATYKF